MGRALILNDYIRKVGSARILKLFAVRLESAQYGAR